MYICIFNAWNKILHSVFFSLFLVILYFVQNDSTAYFIDPVFCEGTDFFCPTFQKNEFGPGNILLGNFLFIPWKEFNNIWSQFVVVVA